MKRKNIVVIESETAPDDKYAIWKNGNEVKQVIGDKWTHCADLSEYSDVDGMKYQNSTITKFPDNWRFAPRTGNNCNYMFCDCYTLTSLDLSSFNTSKVTDMNSMFCNCRNLKSLNLSNFDTSNVTDIYYMFRECDKLTSLDLSSFDVSKVTSLFGAFSQCFKLQTITKGSFKNLKVSLDISSCVVLSKQSVVDLFDSIGTANSGAKITLASAVYSQLSEDEIKVATDKGWTVASN